MWEGDHEEGSIFEHLLCSKLCAVGSICIYLHSDETFGKEDVEHCPHLSNKD